MSADLRHNYLKRVEVERRRESNQRLAMYRALRAVNPSLSEREAWDRVAIRDQETTG